MSDYERTPGFPPIRKKTKNLSNVRIRPKEFRWIKDDDKCDRCGQTAYVMAVVRNEDGEPTHLYFCAHHYHEHARVLREKAATIVDERWRLK